MDIAKAVYGEKVLELFIYKPERKASNQQPKLLPREKFKKKN